MASSANSKETRKRKIDDEMQKFNEKWTSEYFFIENADSRPLCLICNQTVNVNKGTTLNDIMTQNMLTVFMES